MYLWKNEFFQGVWDVAKFANDDEALKKVYDVITKIFEGCKTFEDYYYRVKEIVKPAKYYGDALFSRSLVSIIKAISKCMERGKRCRLWCYQEAILLAAGIKAMNSVWSDQINSYIAESEFDLRFWVGRKERSHVELVIYKWNGSQIRPVSLDTHLENNPYLWNDKARYLNSRMWTEKMG